MINNAHSLKQAIALQAVEESVTYTDSKLGGQPYCKLGDNFPVHSSGTPYMFLAQLNFSQLPFLEDYPQQGLLQFFVLADEDYGVCEDGYYCRYYADFEPSHDIEPFSDEEMEYELCEPIIFGGPYAFKASLREELVPYTDPRSVHYDLPMENSAYSKYFDQTDGSGTKIGGYAFMDKNSFDEKNNGKAELLFQLDMEGDAQKTYAMIADSGTLQFFIERDNLIAKDFSKLYYYLYSL
ncbi:YwqG family protein [Lysinibacillus sp. NPDC056232]|uniref:YwqG family protein n=1 Tax=Lysinibacillus sp. NPDC056232 TaxID=3345756 RepID=UPI0035DD63EE